MDFPDYSGIFKPDSKFQDKYPGFDPWSKENTGTSGPDLSRGPRMAGDVLSKWGRDRDNDFGYYGNRGGGFGGGGFSGGGVQGHGDLTVVYPQQQQPFTIQGSRGFGGPLGTLAGIGASFIPGLGPGIAAAMPAIGGGMGSMFG
jgi:hypothetical protein